MQVVCIINKIMCFIVYNFSFFLERVFETSVTVQIDVEVEKVCVKHEGCTRIWTSIPLGISEVLDQQSYENKTRLTMCGSKEGGERTPLKNSNLLNSQSNGEHALNLTHTSHPWETFVDNFNIFKLLNDLCL